MGPILRLHVLLLLLFAGVSARAASAVPDAGADAPGLRIDTARSLAGFSVRAVWVRRLDGRFAHIEGAVRPEPRPDTWMLEVRVAAGSVLMDKASYEDWARSPEFFDTDRHPWIEYRASDLPGALLVSGGRIEGVLSLRGVSRPASFELLPAECERAGLDCPVRARGEVSRSDFGMDARRLFVSDRVRLNFDIRLHPEAPP